MAERLSKEELFEQVTQAVRASGWNYFILPGPSDASLRLRIFNDTESYPIRVYIWNVTHGGRNRPKNEYRIQITGVHQFQSEPNSKTLILGWWSEAGVFAGFDIRKHSGAFGQSPSYQIAEEALRAAAQNGFAPYDKGNGEIAIAFRPDFFVEYARQLDELHSFGETNETLAVLGAVAENPTAVNDATLEELSEPRRIALRSVRERVRDSRFQSRVLTAYKHRCALCQTQLELVEGAHIIPVVHARSSDEVYNGIALCVLHHRAYDKSLVTIDSAEGAYRTLLNEREVRRLAAVTRDGGIEGFVAGIRSPLHLPNDVNVRPNIELVQFANGLRGWQSLDAADIRVL